MLLIIKIFSFFKANILGISQEIILIDEMGHKALIEVFKEIFSTDFLSN